MYQAKKVISWNVWYVFQERWKIQRKLQKYFNMTSPYIQNKLLCILKTNVLRVLL